MGYQESMLFISGLIMGVSFLDGYLDPVEPKVLYGLILGSIISILLGSMMIITSILLFQWQISYEAQDKIKPN